MDTTQWPQEIVVKPLEEKKTRPQALNCPRCNSTNTKFCYYNNYSLTQPRYFCKSCKRYWTEGGSLRNIPVGGGSRKNKTSSSSNSYSSSKSKLPDLVTHHQNPNKIHDQGQDLNLAFPNSINHDTNIDKIYSSTSYTATTTTSSTLNHNNHQLSAMELITGISSRGLNSFMPMKVVQDPNAVYRTSGFPVLHDFKQPTITPTTLNFSLDHGLGSSGGYGSSSVIQGFHQDHHTSSSTSGRLLFPFEDLKQVSSTSTDIEQNREVHGDSTGYWTGMLGGGSW